MANVTITIPDALVPRVSAALRAVHPELAGMTDVAAFRAYIAGQVKVMVVGYEGEQAVSNQAAQSSADLAGIA